MLCNQQYLSDWRATIVEVLKAVHDANLLDFLEDLGVRQDLEAGRLTCRICGDPVTQDSLGGVYPDSGAVFVFCNKMQCYRDLLRNRSAAKAP